MGDPGRTVAGGATALAEWVDARLDGVDTVLADRIRSAIDQVFAATSLRDVPDVLVAAALARLAPLASDGCTARESALELLAVDALVTLACESLADTCTTAEEIAQRATAMIRAIAAAMPELDGAA